MQFLDKDLHNADDDLDIKALEDGFVSQIIYFLFPLALTLFFPNAD